MKVLKVKFPGRNRTYLYKASDLEIEREDMLVVDTERGPKLCYAFTDPYEMEDAEVPPDAPPISRIATRNDLVKAEQFRLQEPEAYKVCLEKIQSHSLPMKLVAAEYAFDGSKVTFHFTADGRVDFRELVRDLAHKLRTRIEMLQIGVRDESKMTGGIGVCGREFCCSSFLQKFSPVSIKMAKDQSLSLNPAKVSGGCGRLMCCLSYEHDTYLNFRKGLPKIGKRVQCAEGVGKVSRYDIVKGQIVVMLEDNREIFLSKDQAAALLPIQDQGGEPEDEESAPGEEISEE